MKKIPFILPVSLLILALATAFTSPQPPDEKADKILRDSKAKFESLKDFSANFAYTIRNEASQKGRSISQKGTFKIKGDKFVLDLGEQVIFCDGESQWIYNEEFNEVNIQPYDPEDGLNLESIFQVYEANGKSQYVGIESINKSNHHKILLAIADKKLDYNQATLWIGQSSKLPSKALLKDRNQTSTEVLFSNIKINQNISDNDFVFDKSKYPGVEVYDER